MRRRKKQRAKTAAAKGESVMGKKKEKPKIVFLKHDIFTLRDDKIVLLDERFSHVGYSIYWRLLEYMQSTDNCEIRFDLLEVISRRSLASEYEQVKAVVSYCLEIGLFLETQDGAAFYSKRLKENRAEIEGKSEQARKAVEERERKRAEAKKAAETATAENSPYATLCKEICDKFGVKVKPIHYEKLSMLLKHLTGNGVMDIEKAAAVVRATLAKLDTAKAIQSGKFKYTINSFFNPKTFTNLYGGEYDEIYQKPHFK